MNMKNIFSVIPILFVGLQMVAQESPMISEEDKIYVFVQIKPTPKEGLTKLSKKVASKLKKVQLVDNEESIFFGFTVEKDGSLSNITVKSKDINDKNIQKAVRVLEESDWYPAKHNGKIVRYRFVLTVKIN